MQEFWTKVTLCWEMMQLEELELELVNLKKIKLFC